MTEGYLGCIFLYSPRPRVAETKCVKGKEGQEEGKWEREKKEKKKKSKGLNLAIFLICAFLVALSIYGGFSRNKLYKIVFKNSIVLLYRQSHGR